MNLSGSLGVMLASYLSSSGQIREVCVQPKPVSLRFFLALTSSMSFVFKHVALATHRRQGAEFNRMGERLGRATLERPSGTLVWIHASSVGEVASIVRLARAILARPNPPALLITTATRNGAASVSKLISGALHQYLPVDTPSAVVGFLDHWRPDAALFVEADLWPRIIVELEQRGCPMALLNIRASRSRARFPAFYARLLAPMALVTVQEPKLIGEILRLGVEAARVAASGNLKADILLPNVEFDLLKLWQSAANRRVVWAAVSTHRGEEEMIIMAHILLKDPTLLLLVPRHPERGDEVAGLLQKFDVSFTRQSKGEVPHSKTCVHLVDLIGLTGTVYAASQLVLTGGSLVSGIGGHNPHEPAGFGCAIVSGAYFDNFATSYTELAQVGAVQIVKSPENLRGILVDLLCDHQSREAMRKAALAYHSNQTGATEALLELLEPILFANAHRPHPVRDGAEVW